MQVTFGLGIVISNLVNSVYSDSDVTIFDGCTSVNLRFLQYNIIFIVLQGMMDPVDLDLS